MSPTRPVLALDIGGTKIAAGLVGPDGRLLHREQRPTPRSDDAEVVWQKCLAYWPKLMMVLFYSRISTDL